jgi:hypothetical protein
VEGLIILGDFNLRKEKRINNKSLKLFASAAASWARGCHVTLKSIIILLYYFNNILFLVRHERLDHYQVTLGAVPQLWQRIGIPNRPNASRKPGFSQMLIRAIFGERAARSPTPDIQPVPQVRVVWLGYEDL